MNLSEKKTILSKEKYKKKTHSLSSSRRTINKIRKIKPKNLRKKISHKRIKKIDEPTTQNDPLFFTSLPDISRETSAAKNLSTSFTMRQPLLILAFLQPKKSIDQIPHSRALPIMRTD